MFTEGDHTPEIIRQTCEILTNVELRTTQKNGQSKRRKLKPIFAVHGSGVNVREQKLECWNKNNPVKKDNELFFLINGFQTG